MNRRDKKLIFIAVSAASFLATYTGSAINVALPAIGKDLELSHTQLQYIVSVYLMMSAVLLVPFGKLADIYGRRIIFHTGMAIFLISHVASAFATSGWALIAYRGLGGIAAAMFFSNTIAILSSVFSGSERGKILGMNVAITYTGITVGPFVGGFLTTWWGWQSVFLSVAPIVIIGTALSYWKLPRDENNCPSRKFNLSGSVLYVLALVLLIFGLSSLPKMNGIAAIAASFILGTVFFIKDSRSDIPLVNVHLFQKNRIFVFSNLANFIQYLSAFAASFLLSLFLQNDQIKQLSPHIAGFILLTQPLMQALVSPFAGSLSDRIEPRWVASGGMAITAGALCAFVFVSPETSLYAIVLILALLGIGFGFFSSPNNNAIMSSVPSDVYGIASGILATGRILGMSLSMAITAIVFNVFNSKGDSPGAFLGSFHTLFVIFFLLALLGIVSSLIRGNFKADPDARTPGQICHPE